MGGGGWWLVVGGWGGGGGGLGVCAHVSPRVWYGRVRCSAGDVLSVVLEKA